MESFWGYDLTLQKMLVWRESYAKSGFENLLWKWNADQKVSVKELGEQLQ